MQASHRFRRRKQIFHTVISGRIVDNILCRRRASEQQEDQKARDHRRPPKSQSLVSMAILTEALLLDEMAKLTALLLFTAELSILLQQGGKHGQVSAQHDTHPANRQHPNTYLSPILERRE